MSKFTRTIAAAAAITAVAAVASLIYSKRKSIHALAEGMASRFEPTEEEGVFTADPDQDGTADAVAADTTGDGSVDTIVMDTTGDGKLDTAFVDLDGDGVIDLKIDLDSDEAEDQPKPAEE